MNTWNRLLALLDTTLGFPNKIRSTVKKRGQAFDQRTGEHVFDMLGRDSVDLFPSKYKEWELLSGMIPRYLQTLTSNILRRIRDGYCGLKGVPAPPAHRSMRNSSRCQIDAIARTALCDHDEGATIGTRGQFAYELVLLVSFHRRVVCDFVDTHQPQLLAAGNVNSLHVAAILVQPTSPAPEHGLVSDSPDDHRFNWLGCRAFLGWCAGRGLSELQCWRRLAVNARVRHREEKQDRRQRQSAPHELRTHRGVTCRENRSRAKRRPRSSSAISRVLSESSTKEVRKMSCLSASISGAYRTS